MKKIYIIAAILALVTGIAAYSFGKSLEAEAKPPEIPTTTVVITTVDIGEGVFITQEMVQLKAVPSEFVAANAATTLGDVVGKVNKYKCMANQQVTFDQLGSAEDASITAGGRLSYAVTPGMRAMTIYVSEITGVAGYVNPGDHVDIICSYDFNVKLRETVADEENADGAQNVQSANAGEIPILSSSMFLQNIKVLEAGIITQKLIEVQEGVEPTVYTSLTLEVSPEDALKLQFAVTYGEISLLLRAVDDTQSVSPAEFTNYYFLTLADGVIKRIASAGMEVK